jgi:primary-amine oxidase
MESMNAIILNVPEPGEAWSADENGVEIAYCLPPPVSKFDVRCCITRLVIRADASGQYPGSTIFEEDGTPGKPRRVHEMRQQGPYYTAPIPTC